MAYQKTRVNGHNKPIDFVKLAEYIAAGKKPKQIAGELGVSYSTALNVIKAFKQAR